VVFQHWLLPHWRGEFIASHLSYTSLVPVQYQVAVKLHGVFLSCRGSPASSRAPQFHRALRRDTGQVVTPFMQVGIYPTRDFATLGILLLFNRCRRGQSFLSTSTCRHADRTISSQMLHQMGPAYGLWGFRGYFLFIHGLYRPLCTLIYFLGLSC
jgi:hypothetical protein